MDRAATSQAGRRGLSIGDAMWAEAARRYDACHPGDSFDDLRHRASFSKEDRRLMEDWLDAVAQEAQEDGHVS